MASPVNLSSSGPPETVLPAESAELNDGLATARATGDRDTAASLTGANPRSSLAWATLGELTVDTIARYAAYRVGYHRGLDALRANGWRGNGLVRWSHPSNVGFLRCVRGLGETAAEIGETDESERCRQFLLQLDPGGIPSSER